MGTGHSSYDKRSTSGQAPVDPEVARKTAINCARNVPAAELLDVLRALGIDVLARPPRRTRKARR